MSNVYFVIYRNAQFIHLARFGDIKAGVGNPGPGEPQGVLAFVITQ